LWRAPLRAALNLLRDDTAGKFETVGSDLLRDPWVARNEYIDVILDPHGCEKFLARHAVGAVETSRVWKLLEMQRSALLMFTSCGWFFSDLAGIETVQVLRYAARIIELQKELGIETPRTTFLEMLSEARSNVRERGTGADIFLGLETHLV
jgi:alpha-amylase/alpha-mannosidase (GH57 family)